MKELEDYQSCSSHDLHGCTGRKEGSWEYVDQRLTVKEKSQSQPGSDTMTEFGKYIFYTIVLYRDWKFINAQKSIIFFTIHV